jgi:hypothetical protein
MAAEVKILPVVQRDGTAVWGLSSQVRSIEVCQIVGGAHNGERGSWSELAKVLERDGVMRQEGTHEVVLAETGEVLAPQTLALPLAFDALRALERLARERGISAEGLLQGFVADLTATLAHHGADEVRYARQWLGHVGWPRRPPSVASQVPVRS